MQFNIRQSHKNDSKDLIIPSLPTTHQCNHALLEGHFNLAYRILNHALLEGHFNLTYRIVNNTLLEGHFNLTYHIVNHALLEGHFNLTYRIVNHALLEGHFNLTYSVVVHLVCPKYHWLWLLLDLWICWGSLGKLLLTFVDIWHLPQGDRQKGVIK